MSVTFIDPPGPLGNSSEPIDFTTDNLVTSISVEFNPESGRGSRLTVWDGTDDGTDQGGDFSYAFRNSSSSDLTIDGPYTWHIVPAGRWPADFRIRVKESSQGGGTPPEPVYYPALTPTVYSPVAQYALQGGVADYTQVRRDRSGNGYHLTKGTPDEDYDFITGQKCIKGVPGPGEGNATRLQRPAYTAALQITGDFTMSCRVKRLSGASGPIVCMSGYFNTGGDTRNTLYTCSILSNGVMETFWETTHGNSQTRQSSTVNVPLNQWCWVTFRRNGTTGVWTFGVNLGYENSSSGALPTNGTEAFLSVASQDEASDSYWGGDLADVSIWDVRLSDAQLLPLYKNAMGVP